ncbi:MAG: FAD-dependent thymidylate synthase [Pelolinea sp.]|nr:FAD-dependent thymidylate synthase [Pelolinea sp.]
MPQPRKIYLLDPRHLSPETIAVAFAKTSRSPQTFQEIADELSDEKSADFHEKWVVGYGHSSVAEHAVLHIALENVSRLSVECIESNRLASYTEKSSRYQVWDRDHFYVPLELASHPLENEYISLNQRLFDHYQIALEKVAGYLKCSQPQQESESERAYSQRLRTCCADVCRYYLPASALANVGMTINARALEHAITKLLSHPLNEVQTIGRDIKAASQKIVPTLVKYSIENPYLKGSESVFHPLANYEKSSSIKDNDWFKYVNCDPEGETRILASLLFRFGEIPFDQAVRMVEALAPDAKKEIAFNLLGRLGEHDIPLRELEYASISFEALLDQGAYFELKRHRMMTQTTQALTARQGYAIPSLLEEAEVLSIFIADMADVEAFYEKLCAFNPPIASYIVPNAFNRRVLVQINLRSALHFIKLRSASNAHFAIRRVALRMAEEIRLRYPLFARYFSPAGDETWQSISTQSFSRLF